MIGEVVSLKAPWAQVPGETDQEYLQFLGWLPGRGPPHAPHLAARNRWTERATAYDRLSDAQENETWDQTEARFKRTVGREIRKLDHLSQTNQGMVPIPRDLVTALGAARGVPGVVGGEPLPVEDLTEEELRTLAAADKIQERHRAA